MFCGVYFKQVDFKNTEFKDFQWVKTLINQDNIGLQAVSFNISIFSVIGMFFLIFYTVNIVIVILIINFNIIGTRSCKSSFLSNQRN